MNSDPVFLGYSICYILLERPEIDSINSDPGGCELFHSDTETEILFMTGMASHK